MDKILKNKLIEKAKLIYKNENSGHDFSHIERVINYCEIIQKNENADWDIIFISALFHDVHRVMSNKVGRYVSAVESVDEVKNILNEYIFDDEILSKILYIIANHDRKTLKIDDMSKELQIVQDADILDSIGQKGLERTLKYCKTKHIPVTNTKYPLNTEKYVLNINPISTSHYITRTMIPQISYIHTESAKLLAQNQIKILQDFVDKNIKEHNINNYEI